MTVKTRFAPSPTGALHIGGARTALFAYLFAKHHNGEFLLRIEDTDRERSTPENIQQIHDAMTWLELTPDAEPVLQTKNQAMHQEAVKQLVANGAAYEDDGAIRFKVPQEDVTFTDLVLGDITTPHTSPSMKDFVIQRSDGTPTYNLAVVCDDHAMGITHVIRGDDHVNNTPKQILLFRALGYPVPEFGHIPMVLGEDGKKLSKRHGAAAVQEFAEQGYLPLAVQNQLMRLGWTPSKEDVISLTQAAAEFDFAQASKKSSVFDYKKLAWFNSQVMNSLDIKDLRGNLEFSKDVDAHVEQRLTLGLPALLERATTLNELIEQADIYFDDGFTPVNEKAEKALVDGKAVIHALSAQLESLPDWTEDAIYSCFTSYLEETGQGFKVLGLPMRVALTGKTGGPSIANVAYALGKQETLNRLAKATA